MLTSRLNGQTGNPCSGFTLIEFLIAALLLAIVALGALGFLSRANARLVELAEAEELEHRRSVTLANLRHDFEQAGMHLLSPQLRVHSQEAVYLASSSHYQTDNLGRCRKLTDDLGTHTTAVRGMYASGWLQFSPQRTGAGKVGFLGRDHSVTALHFLPNEATGGGELRYYREISGMVVANPVIDSAHLPGDYYRLLIEGERPQVTVKIYRVKQAQPALLLATYTEEAQYPYLPLAELAKTGAEINNMLMSGTANAVVRTGPALLPVDTAVGANRLPSVVNIRALGEMFESVSLLQGDINVDLVRTIQDVSNMFAAISSDTLLIKSPCNGQYSVGDVVMLIDDTSQRQRTALYRVVAPAPVVKCGTDATLTLRRVPSEAPAWQRLYSPPSDYQYEFPKSKTQVVKLLPPVTYRLDVMREKLLRREGNREGVVVSGVTDFIVNERVQYGVTSYEIKCGLRREGFAAQAGGEAAGYTTVSVVASPWALSQAYQYQKLGPLLE